MIEVGPDKLKMEFMKWAVSKVDEKGAPKSRSSEKAEAKAEEAEAEADTTQEEAPKTVKKPKRLGFKSDGDEDGGSEEDAK
jgi:hypothetical protein